MAQYVIRRDECGLYVRPMTEEVAKILTLTYVQDKEIWRGRRVVGREKVTVHEPLFEVIQAADGAVEGRGHQGMWLKLRDELTALGRTVEVVNMCPLFPAPDFSVALRRLRLPQKRLLVAALMQDHSGKIAAPTRFGKAYMILAVALAFPGLMTIVTMPGVDLCRQMYKFLKENLPRSYDVKLIGAGSTVKYQSDGLTVVSMDSLHKCFVDKTRLMMIDEAHAVPAESRSWGVSQFYNARKLAFSGSMAGRSDQKDGMIEALVGPLLAEKTYLEAVEEGSISRHKTVFLRVPFSKDELPGKKMTGDKGSEALLFHSEKMAKLHQQILDYCIPKTWQVMTFIKDEVQADMLALEGSEMTVKISKANWGDDLLKTVEELVQEVQHEAEFALAPEQAVAMAKKLRAKEREKLTADVVAGLYTRVIASRIWIQGLTFPFLKLIINYGAGGPFTGAIQRPGRTLGLEDGKNYGLQIDIMFECTDADQDDRKTPPYGQLVGMGWSRLNLYKKIGYDVHIVDTLDELKAFVLGAYES